MTQSHSHDPVSPVIRYADPVPEAAELKSTDSRGVGPTLINLIVVSPHLEVRRQLADAIGPQPDLAVVAYATPVEALQWSDLASCCQAVLIQVRCPLIRLQTIRVLRSQYPFLPMVAILDYATLSIRRGAKRAGATASASLHDLVELVIIARQAGSGTIGPIKRGRRGSDHPSVSDMLEWDGKVQELVGLGRNARTIVVEMHRSRSDVYKSLQRSKDKRNKTSEDP